jgi:hypothetical protein
LQAFYFRRKT